MNRVFTASPSREAPISHRLLAKCFRFFLQPKGPDCEEVVDRRIRQGQFGIVLIAVSLNNFSEVAASTCMIR